MMSELITEKKLKFIVPPGKKKERIDFFLTHSIEYATRTRVQNLIEAGFVLVNGSPTKQNYKLRPGDEIDVTIPIKPRPENIEPEDIPLNIIYEDEYFLIVNKPPGMVVHPATGNYKGTLVNALLNYTKNLSLLNEPEKPGIVHRIDKDTSGLLIVVKDEITHSLLAKQFAQHTIEREYWAVAWGLFKEKEGEINFNITRSKSDRKKFTSSLSEGKTAITFYSVIEEYEFSSLVKLNLKTGRTHQIRVHLSAINHPIFGDPVYGGRKVVYGLNQPNFKFKIENLLKLIPRQALHAKTLGIFHPHKREIMRFDSQLPNDMQTLIHKLKTE